MLFLRKLNLLGRPCRQSDREDWDGSNRTRWYCFFFAIFDLGPTIDWQCCVFQALWGQQGLVTNTVQQQSVPLGLSSVFKRRWEKMATSRLINIVNRDMNRYLWKMISMKIWIILGKKFRSKLVCFDYYFQEIFLKYIS